MPCTDESPCHRPELRWVHSQRCQDEKSTYRVRASIGLALMTNRPELLRLHGIDKTPLTNEEQWEIMRLVEDLLIDREKYRVKIERLQVRVRQTVMGAKGSIQALEKVVENLNKPEDLQENEE